MDITGFVSTKRDRALLVGDYDSYRSSLSRQLLALRRRLGRTTPKNAKFTAKAPVTVENIASNAEFSKIFLIQAERAWAHAMHIKSSHAEDNASKGISGSTRRHIISKLHKAATHAEQLATLLSDRSACKASDNDYLEAKAYASSLKGSAEFEKQVSKRFEDPSEQKAAWRKCLVSFSEAHVIYSALLFATQKDTFREVIGGSVDPSIRYAAYQSKLARTIATSTVAKRSFDQDQKDLLALVKKMNPNALNEEVVPRGGNLDDADTAPIPSAISWRSRSAPIADAAIGQAISVTALASSKLSALFSSAYTATSPKSSNPRSLAAAYDPILTSAQDTADAVRRAISDLSKEGVAESDPRMQDLRVSDLAVNYSLISWRIGRNRVLISGASQDDGATFEPQDVRLPKTRSKAKAKTDKDTKPHRPKGESTPHRLARLTERIVLLDSTLQSIDSIKFIPGASRDADFMAELDAQRAYFQALKCLNIGYSHRVISHHVEALALFARAESILNDPSIAIDTAKVSRAPTTTPGLLANLSSAGKTPPTLLIAPESLESFRRNVATLILRQRGLVALHAYFDEYKSTSDAPLVDNLDKYPRSGKVDLKNIVTYPPRLEPVPVKPIFLDLAWNYIDYPGRGKEDEDGDEGKEGGLSAVATKVNDVVSVVAGAAGGADDKGQKKRGWFNFGR